MDAPAAEGRCCPWRCASWQLAITLGASLGGLLFDMRGYQSTFFVSAVLLCAAAYLAFKAGRAADTV